MKKEEGDKLKKMLGAGESGKHLGEKEEGWDVYHFSQEYQNTN